MKLPVTLADVPELAVRVAWQEAVALVQEWAALSTSLGGISLPKATLLLPHGELKSDGVAASSSPVALALYLASILDGPGIPQGLKALIEANRVAPPQQATVAHFAEALAYFERPHRRADVAAVYARTLAAKEDADATARVEELRQKAAGAPVPKAPTRWRVAPLDRTTRTIAIATFLVVVAVGFITIVMVRVAVPTPIAHAESPSTTVPSIADSAWRRVTDALQAGLLTLGVGATSKAAPSPSEAPAEPVSKSPVRRRPGGPPSGDPTAAATPRSTVDLQVNLSSGDTSAPAEPSDTLPESDEAAFGGGEAYSPADTDVEPARLKRPQMPSTTPRAVDEQNLGVVDLLIDEVGDVEQVRLVSPGNRYHERMIVSAAKAWKFVPATKDGRPVRYRLRIRLTV